MTRVLLFTSCFALLVGVASAADTPPSGVDESLRQQLEADLLEGLGEASPAKQPNPVADEAKPSTPANDVDEKLLENLAAGEDVGPQQHPLARIGGRMKLAERLITQRNTSQRTQQLQGDIIAELDKLLQQARKQSNCKGGNCQKPGEASSTAQAKQPGEAKPGTGQPNAQASDKPATDSTARLGTAQVVKASPAVVESLQRQAWGQLPERLRQQLQSGVTEEFLPRYVSQIEAYFQRLAEPSQP